MTRTKRSITYFVVGGGVLILMVVLVLRRGTEDELTVMTEQGWRKQSISSSKAIRQPDDDFKAASVLTPSGWEKRFVDLSDDSSDWDNDYKEVTINTDKGFQKLFMKIKDIPETWVLYKEARVLEADGWKQTYLPAGNVPADWDGDFDGESTMFVPKELVMHEVEHLSASDSRRKIDRLLDHQIGDRVYYSTRIRGDRLRSEFEEGSFSVEPATKDAAVYMVFVEDVPEPNRADSFYISRSTLRKTLEDQIVREEEEEIREMLRNKCRMPRTASDVVGRYVCGGLRGSSFVFLSYKCSPEDFAYVQRNPSADQVKVRGRMGTQPVEVTEKWQRAPLNKDALLLLRNVRETIRVPRQHVPDTESHSLMYLRTAPSEQATWDRQHHLWICDNKDCRVWYFGLMEW